MTKKKVSCPNKYHIEKLSNYADLCFAEKKDKGEDGGGGRRRFGGGGGGGDDDEDIRFGERLQSILFISDIRLDIPDGSSYSPKSSKRETSNGGKATQSVSRPKGSSKGGRRH